jgi:hypothetical protein
MTLTGAALAATPAPADVIIRGPFGRAIVVQAPVDVRVGPGVIVGVPSAPPPGYYPAPVAKNSKAVTNEPPIVSNFVPAVRTTPAPDGELPLPRILKDGNGAMPAKDLTPVPQPETLTAVDPREFAKTFRPLPGGGTYEVVFVHSRSKQPVAVTFELPAGNPKVSFAGHSLLFDYGRHDVEVRFQIGGKVKVSSR